MKRQVICEDVEQRVTVVKGPTPDGLGPDGEELLAPEIGKVETYVRFYDFNEAPDAPHRNGYAMLLTPEEASKFVKDSVYTLTIS